MNNPDDRPLSEWLFQRRRPRRDRHTWTTTTTNKEKKNQ